jgi:hypothetical protein
MKEILPYLPILTIIIFPVAKWYINSKIMELRLDFNKNFSAKKDLNKIDEKLDKLIEINQETREMLHYYRTIDNCEKHRNKIEKQIEKIKG